MAVETQDPWTLEDFIKTKLHNQNYFKTLSVNFFFNSDKYFKSKISTNKLN